MYHTIFFLYFSFFISNVNLITQICNLVSETLLFYDLEKCYSKLFTCFE